MDLSNMHRSNVKMSNANWHSMHWRAMYRSIERMSAMRSVVVTGLTCACLAFSLGCDKPTAGDPYADMVAEAVPKIEQSVGLKFKQAPKVEPRTKEQVREFVLKQVTEPTASKQLAGMETAYKAFGLIPDTLDLKKFLVSLLQEQIVGYYDPETKVLYVVDGAPQDALKVTVTHELVHALQDQYVSLDSVQKMIDVNDRQEAAQAVFEGQAVYEQLSALLGASNIAAALPGGWDRVRQLIRNNQASMPIYAAAPLVIQETLLFPYLSGAEFIKNYKEREKGVPYIPYTNMPVSTEQIMHPSAYFDKRDDPTPISFLPIPGEAPVYSNELGEFETRIFLFQYLQNQDDATRGADGWDGDHYEIFDMAGGRGFAWASVWDSKGDAADFYELMHHVEDARQKAYPGRKTDVLTGEVSGRPVVLYIDVPAGGNTNFVTLKSIQVGTAK
jgi:hypothetical protein